MSNPEARVTATPDGRPIVRCGLCGTKFTPGVGRPVPEKCIGCRAVYRMKPTTRHAIDVVTAKASEVRTLSARFRAISAVEDLLGMSELTDHQVWAGEIISALEKVGLKVVDDLSGRPVVANRVSA